MTGFWAGSARMATCQPPVVATLLAVDRGDDVAAADAGGRGGPLGPDDRDQLPLGRSCRGWRRKDGHSGTV